MISSDRLEPTRPLEALRPALPVRPAGPELTAPMVHTPASGSMAALSAAAEELSFGMATRVALRNLGTPGRTHLATFGRDPGSLRQLYRIARLRGLHAAFNDAAEHEQAGIMAAELLMKAREGGDVKSLADLQHADPFKRYVFLLEAQELAERAHEQHADVRGRLAHALTGVWDEHQRTIQAGFHTARPLARFAQHGHEWDEFRGIYFNWVIQGGSLSTTFKSLLQKFGAERMREAVDTLRQALAADLASTVVNADWARMVQQQGDLERNRTIWSLVVEADEFLAGLGRRPAPEHQVMAFVAEALDCASLGASERRLHTLCALALPGSEITEALRWRVRVFLKQKLLATLWSSAEARDALFLPAFAAPAR
jgi:type III secretion system YopN/LcrE/InvE/MxiC family regulator